MAPNAPPEPPNQLKAIQSFMKIASDIERLDPVVAYWVRLYSVETAFSIDKNSPECQKFLHALILWLEEFKQTHKDNEAVSNQTVGQAHMENFVVALFNKADTIDREGKADKNTVKMFYMAAVLFEAMAAFGPLTEEVSKKSKYAKFKAAYIQKCLKAGQTPKPGPLEGPDLEDPAYAPETNLPSSDPAIDQPSKALTDKSNNSDIGPPKQEPFILTPSSAPVNPPPVKPSPASTPAKTTSDYVEPTKPKPTTPASLSGNSTASTITATKFHAINGAPLTPEDIISSQKYCKFANSALQYDDIQTAVANLEKALKLLTTGQKS